MRYRISTILLSCLAIAVTLAPIAHADDGGGWIVTGGALQPMQSHPSVRMVSEIVDVKLGGSRGSIGYVYVRCQFEFRNEGPAQDVVMAFPENSSGYGDSSATERLKGFKSWVDDKPVQVNYRPSAKNGTFGIAKLYKAWYVKTVHFNAGQTRKVVDMYASGPGVSDAGGLPRDYGFTYVLRTGASWKRPIGKATINVDTSAAGGFYAVKASPKGCKMKGDKYTWVMSNFEPKQDISLSLSLKKPLLDGKPVRDMNYWISEPVVHGVLVVPVYLVTAAGGGMEWENGECVLSFGSHTLRLRGGSRTATIDGRKTTLSVPPDGDQGSEWMSAPLEDMVRLLGGTVKYTSDHTPNVILKASR